MLRLKTFRCRLTKDVDDKALVYAFEFPNSCLYYDLHVAAGRIFPSIPGAIASLSVLLFIQTCEFRLFLSSSPLIPQAGIRRWGGVRGELVESLQLHELEKEILRRASR